MGIIQDSHVLFYICMLSCHQPNKTGLEVQLDLLWTVVYGLSTIIRNKRDSK